MKTAEYEKIVAPFRKQINVLSVENDSLVKTLNESIRESSNLKAENTRLQNWVNRLLEYMEMSQEDLKVALEKDKAIIKSAKAFETMMGFAQRLGGYVK